MTREEAKELKLLCFNFDDKPTEESLSDEMILIIDKIYDDFDADMKLAQKIIEKQGQTCISCKWLDRDTGKSYSICDYLDTIISAGMVDTFYCSEWEKE